MDGPRCCASRVIAPSPSCQGGRCAAASSGAFTLVEIMVVVVLIGLLASLAMPAYRRIVQRSQDQAVTNNARQLASAINQYFSENGASTVTLDTLTGSNAYLNNIRPVAGETYPTIYTQNVAVTITGVGGARTITYVP